jgi:prolyl 4-hydroxylase
VIPRTPTVRCIEARARAIQGWRDEVWIERLRTQRYLPGGHYGYHFDWSSNFGGWGRVSTFMAYVDDGDGTLRGGATEFPRVSPPKDARWCRFLECPPAAEKEGGSAQGEKMSRPASKPSVFKALPGNAVYWENFRPDGTGRGFDETWHAGLPVEEGVKVGLNIWSWGRID